VEEEEMRHPAEWLFGYTEVVDGVPTMHIIWRDNSELVEQYVAPAPSGTHVYNYFLPQNQKESQ
jgi:hypothetical protein